MSEMRWYNCVIKLIKFSLRVAWYPVGLYHEKRAERSRRLCYTVITICLMAGTVALVVSWLLATGIIDPDRTNYQRNSSASAGPRQRQEPRNLDYWSKDNAIEKYPNVVKAEKDSKDVTLFGVKVHQAEVESVTGPEEVFENENDETENLEVTTIVTEMEMGDFHGTMELNDEAEVVNILDDSFQVSAESDEEEEATIQPDETEITTFSPN